MTDILTRLRAARGWLPPGTAREAAEEIENLRAEVTKMRAALAALFPAEEGYGESFDELRLRGLLVEVPADDRYREEWDEDTMWTWRWRAEPEPDTYPCSHPGCTTVRTAAQGGATFTVCDEHWDSALDAGRT